jgi:hypothetical protein
MAMETVFISSSLNQAGASGYCAIRCAAPAGTWVLARTQRVSLSEARIAAGDARKLIAKGVDPLGARRSVRKAETPVPTFGEIAQLVIADAKRESANAKVRYQWERHLGPVYC